MSVRDPNYPPKQSNAAGFDSDLLRAFQDGRIESYLAQAPYSHTEKTYLSAVQATSWVDFAVKAFRILSK
ncbi:MAG: hypothetical protein JXA25_12515 [Anaerolineales bacterium]|nr:hypothetical protein [Anaerolineales bacterium]